MVSNNTHKKNQLEILKITQELLEKDLVNTTNLIKEIQKSDSISMLKQRKDYLSNRIDSLGMGITQLNKTTLEGIRELKQETSKLNKTIEIQNVIHQKTHRNLYLVVGLFSVLLVVSISVVIFNIDDSDPYIFSSGFLIQNLKGDTIDTWVSWKITEGDAFHIHVVDSVYATDDRINTIIDVIMSTEEIEIDDSLLNKGPEGTTSIYYSGWFGALNSISVNTESPIPKNLHPHAVDKGEGNILIKLSNLSSPDGYSGFTTAIVDQPQHQILKSTITIYNIDSMSIEQLKTILRHELGHGFGLAHSSAPEDLMAPIITTNYPYISGCDLDAISLLYDGGESSQVVCEK